MKKKTTELPKIKTEKDRSDRIVHLNGRIKRAKDTLQSFKVEMRDLSKAQQEPYVLKSKG